MPWEIVRPDDGLPAARRSVRCRACGKELTFTVYSVTGTGRRQARWRASAWGGLGTLVAGVAVLFSGAIVGVGVALVIAGPILGLVFGTAASDEVGISGHGNGFPVTNAKHSVTASPPPHDLPDLTCTRCGHMEEFPRAAYFRDDYVREQYEAARDRFARHVCLASGGTGPK
ncbi:hypothetical protein OOK36_56780 [Streptomyces sp. NBC_00365]|uniref:hypothetical protein n=1 Tax=Streptomyces sp. NBC_00365 TaxID=2975726 RepID=UPI002252F774|nr:hypothetical protein [Streptomyces sp. NBC_00365]MCX5097894.1 hypothetical protein [Streptomyces sp. NBC_00365]